MNYVARLSAAAAKKLAHLDRPTRDRIFERLRQLESDPYDSRLGKPLVNAAGRWSSRVGNTWRIIYRIDRQERIVRIEAIQSRGEVYKRM